MADLINSGNKKDKWTKRVTDLLNWLNEKKQAKLVEGDNVTLTPQQDGTVRIDADGGGASSLGDLTDVDVSSVTDGQALVYDETNEKWVAGEAGQVDDVVMNGNSIVTNKVASFKNYVEITRSQYDALPDTKYSDGILYCITDSGVKREGTYSPVIYSLAEREIGVWTDGKPLYQRTVHINALPSTPWTETSYPHGIANIDNIVSYECRTVWSSGTIAMNDKQTLWNYITVQSVKVSSSNTSDISMNVNKDVVYFVVGSDRSNLSADVTIRYTKTTDNAGAGSWTTDGVPTHHYSTSEQVIGTWIDGKTLYEKTVVFGTQLTISSNTWTDTELLKSGIDNIVEITTMNTDGTTWSSVGCRARASTSSYVQLFNTRNADISIKYITIRYTKTS